MTKEITLTKDTFINGKIEEAGKVIMIEELEELENKETVVKEEKILKESANIAFTVVYVNAMDSAVVELNERTANDIKGLRDKAYKILLASDENASDDFWIDDIWLESGLDVAVDWKDILAPGGVLDEDMVSFIFDNSTEFAIKVQFYTDQGNKINPKNIESDIEAIELYDAGGESWVEGNYRTFIPEGWLEEYADSQGWVTGIIKENYSYFEEGFARVVSDLEPNGEMIMDRIGDYFVYM